MKPQRKYTFARSKEHSMQRANSSLSHSKPVSVYDSDMCFVNTYMSYKEAEAMAMQDLGITIPPGSISTYVKKGTPYKGFTFISPNKKPLF